MMEYVRKKISAVAVSGIPDIKVIKDTHEMHHAHEIHDIHTNHQIYEIQEIKQTHATHQLHPTKRTQKTHTTHPTQQTQQTCTTYPIQQHPTQQAHEPQNTHQPHQTQKNHDAPETPQPNHTHPTQDSTRDSLADFLSRVSQKMYKAVKTLGAERGSLQEIRIRVEKPVSFYLGNRELYITESGGLTDKYGNGQIYKKRDVEGIFSAISENSIYAYQEEIKNGYITIRGGHRVGIAGKVVMENGSEIKHIKEISALNIRVAGQIKNCGYKLLPYIVKNEKDIYNTLIVSPPGCGKTTLLRDLTRLLSNGVDKVFKGVNVGLVDERSEIAACYKGVPQNDVGRRTDVLDGCPKAKGMLMLLRSMSPQIIVTDEIGGSGDGEAVKNVANAGVRLLTTAHGYCSNGLMDLRREARELIKEGIFQKIIVLDNSRGPGTVREIIDLGLGVSGWNQK